MTPRHKLVSQAELARMKGMSVEGVRQWRSSGGCPFVQRGRNILFDPIAVDRRRERRAKECDKSALSRARLDKMLAQVKLAEYELARQRERLVPRELVEQALAIIKASARSRLVPLGDVLAPRIAGLNNIAAIRKVIDDEVYAALTDLAEGKQ
jgi:hypothetical protein